MPDTMGVIISYVAFTFATIIIAYVMKVAIGPYDKSKEA